MVIDQLVSIAHQRRSKPTTRTAQIAAESYLNRGLLDKLLKDPVLLRPAAENRRP